MFSPIRRMLTLAWVLLALAVSSSAQRYSFRNYADGLGNLNVTSLLQSKAGFLWVGTQSGLFRYDGTRFREYGASDGLEDTFIVSLAETGNGQLWISTRSALYFLTADGRLATVKHNGRQLEMRPGTKIAAAQDGSVLVAGRIGLFRLQSDAGQWSAELVQAGAEDDSPVFVWSLLGARDGAVWFGCGDDLCRKKDGVVDRWATPTGAKIHGTNHWTSLLEDRRGRIWMSGDTHLGVFQPLEQRFELRDLPGALTGKTPLPPVEDKQGRILSGAGANLARYESAGWKVIGAEQGLSRMNIATVMVDKEGSVWMGLMGHGLQRWLGQDQWEAWTAADGLNNDLVWAIHRDLHGRLWIGTEGGLNYMPAGSKQVRGWSQAGIESAQAVSIAESADGYLWVGTSAGRLIRINEQTLQARQWHYKQIRRVTVDSQDRLWVATDRGLQTGVGRGEARVLSAIQEPELANERVPDVREGPDGSIWTVSEQSLFRLDTAGRWHRIVFDFDAAKINRVDEVAPGPKGEVLLEGGFAGLRSLRIRQDRVAEVQALNKPTLLSDTTDFINFDRRGWLWVGQDHGVNVFDGRAWRRFTQDSGLIWNDCSQSAFYLDHDGSAWIGTAGGLAHLLNPLAGSLEAPPRPTFVYATMGTAAVANGSTFKWHGETLAIGMASLTFRDVGAIRFRYRLGGVDPDWVQSRGREARYPQLAPGSYRFEAVAIDTSNNTQSDVQELIFEVTPPWWQSRWFYAGASVLLLALTVFAWRWHTGQLLERQRHLEACVAQRTRELEAEKMELVRTREQLRELAAQDGLTGLWNRRTILEHLEGELARARREGSSLAVIMADVDHFKRINDAFGHVVGDAVLREAALRFTSGMRSYDHVGRYGGEEFLFVLPHCDVEIAARRGEELRALLARTPLTVGDHHLDLTASFGVAVSIGGMTGVQTIVRAADAALYIAKQDGRDRVEIATEAVVQHF